MKIQDLKGKSFRYDGDVLLFEIGAYGDGNPAILVFRENGGLYAKVSVNMQSDGSALTSVDWDEFIYVKNYNENKKLVNYLFKEGWLIDTGEYITIGHVNTPLCRVGIGT